MKPFAKELFWTKQPHHGMHKNTEKLLQKYIVQTQANRITQASVFKDISQLIIDHTLTASDYACQKTKEY